jgi:DnaJ-class molecular chaperone
MAKKDFYTTLGVSKNATEAEIKTAYRRLARQHHPDVDKSEGSAEKFKEISEAYQILSDPNKRRTYDQFGSQAFEPGAGPAGGNPFAGAQGNPFGGFSYSWSSSSGQPFVDPFDLFEQIFGGGFAQEFAQGFRRRQTYQMDLS